MSISVTIPTNPAILSNMFCIFHSTALPKKKLSPNITTPNNNKGIRDINNIVICCTYSFTVLNTLNMLSFFVFDFFLVFTFFS